jgi:hypothetical protein
MQHLGSIHPSADLAFTKSQVLQEVATARHISIVCGENVLTGDDLVHGMRMLRTIAEDNPDPTFLNPPVLQLIEKHQVSTGTSHDTLSS